MSQVDDKGTVVRVQFLNADGTAMDISSATVTKEIIFKKPGGGILVKPAAFTTNGTNGKAQVVMGEDELRPGGEWRVQGYADVPALAWAGHTKVGAWTVYCNLR